MLTVVGEGSWQWRPGAAITAADTTQRCTALALLAPDGGVVCIRPRRFGAPHLRAAIEDGQKHHAEDLVLEGHHESPVTTLRFFACADSPAVLLASASSDCVLVWHLDAAFAVRKTVVDGSPRGEATCVAFDHTGSLLAVAVDREVDVRIIHSGEVYVTLEGHLGRVTKCEFHPLRHHLLLTCSEDRTFKMWDLSAKMLLFQSAVLSAFPILSLALNPITGDAALGFGDGMLRVYTLNDNFAREHAVINVEGFMRRHVRKKQRDEDLQELQRESPNVVSSLPVWARSERASETAQIQAYVATNASRVSYSDFADRQRPPFGSSEGPQHSVEVACPILGLRYVCIEGARRNEQLGPPSAPAFNAHGERELLDREQYLALAVPSHLVVVNAFSYELSILHDFQVPPGRGFDPVAVAKELSFFSAEGSDGLECGVVSAFSPCFTMISTVVGECRPRSLPPAVTNVVMSNNNDSHQEPQQQHAETAEARGGESRLSVIATEPPPRDSVLSLPPLALLPAKSATPCKLDKPITFRTRIKSSGYGASNPTKRLSIAERKTGTAARAKSPGASTSAPTTSASVETFLREYPTQCGLLRHHQPQHALPPTALHHGAIHALAFSADAKWLASAGGDKLALISKLPFSRFQGEGSVFAGHEHAVRRVHWSHSNRMLVTTAADRTARVWLTDSDVASLTLHGVVPKSTNQNQGAGAFSSARKALKQELVDARFFYMDKFLVSASGNVVRLHQFALDGAFAARSRRRARPGAAELVPHEPDQSRKRKVAEWAFADMQTLTALACVNGSFLSSAVVVAGSDRSLRIVDAATGQTARVIADAHARAAHTLALPAASCFASHPANFYDLLLSSAPTSTIHLWDIRADNCVMRFGEHVNRVHALGVAFSPCMRYVATGSEDRQGYVYDLRTGRCVTKLPGHTDAVTAVAFNPLHPQLATASYDGTIRFYSDGGKGG